MNDGSAVLTKERARIIKDAFDNWLKIGFFAGNIWQRYSLEHSTFKCYTQENYEWKVRWSYNVIEVELTSSNKSEFLAVRTDEGNIILFKIEGEK